MDSLVAVTLKQPHMLFFFLDDFLELPARFLIGHERSDHLVKKDGVFFKFNKNSEQFIDVADNGKINFFE